MWERLPSGRTHIGRLLLGLLAELADDLGEAVEDGDRAQPVAVVDGGVAADGGAGGDVGGIPVCAVATAPSPMVRWPATPTWPARMTFLPTWVEPERPTCEQSSVSAPTEEPWPTMDEVVDLGAGVDAGFADGGAVDGGVGLDFDVVVEDGDAGLEDLVPGRCVG